MNPATRVPEPLRTGAGHAGSREPFFFAIPLIGRAASRDWSRVCGLLRLTLRSILSQSDPDFEVLVAGQDHPDWWSELARTDRRLRFLKADWPSEPATAANDDGGRKKALLKQHVSARGGGLLMFVDGDDLVDREVVSGARRWLSAEAVGGLVLGGVAIDLRACRAIRLPAPGIFGEPLYKLCGSTTIARIQPASPLLERRDPHAVLGSHHEWDRMARRLGLRLSRLPLWAGYLVNTGENHSETAGPFSEWRQDFSRAVRNLGTPISDTIVARFGIKLADLRLETSVGPRETAAGVEAESLQFV